MAQSEAGKTATTVPNDEAEEEFGPQLISKLANVCIHNYCDGIFNEFHNILYVFL